MAGLKENLIEAAQSLLDTMESPRSQKATDAWLKLRDAIKAMKDAAADETDIERAREGYGNDECEIDDDAVCSPSDEGTWVQAWVWLAKPGCATCGETDCGGECLG